jgi:hypothetical protein
VPAEPAPHRRREKEIDMRLSPLFSALLAGLALLLAPAPADEPDPAPPPSEGGSEPAPPPPPAPDDETKTAPPDADNPPPPPLPPGGEEDDPPTRPPDGGEPPPPPPPGTTMPASQVECDWAWMFRASFDDDKHSMSCAFWPDPCEAESSTSVDMIALAGKGWAYDKTMFNSATTSSSSLADGALAIWRTDYAPCSSEFDAAAHVSFKAGGAIDPPATARVGGDMSITGGRIRARASGTVTVTSEGDSPGATVRVGDTQVQITGDGAQSMEQHFKHDDQAKWLSTGETFLFSGTVFVSDWANAWILNGKAKASSFASDSRVRFEVWVRCFYPCSRILGFLID